VLDWATARGHRVGENPARWRGHLENLLPKRSKVRRVEHHPALPYANISAFLAELRQQEGVPARALEFGILTAARAGELVGARWDEINLADRIWVVPAGRMKSGAEHRVPLNEPAMAIVDQMQAIRQNDYLFPGRKPSSPITSDSLWQLLRRMGHDNITIHGFRSSFRDWVAERTNYPAEIAEMALAHKVGSAVEQAYRRTDMFQKRRQLAEAWGAFCFTPSGRAGEVVSMRSAQ